MALYRHKWTIYVRNKKNVKILQFKFPHIALHVSCDVSHQCLMCIFFKFEKKLFMSIESSQFWYIWSIFNYSELKPISLLNVSNLIHEFFKTILLNFLVKLDIQKLNGQICWVFMTKWLTYFYFKRRHSRSETIQPKIKD